MLKRYSKSSSGRKKGTGRYGGRKAPMMMKLPMYRAPAAAALNSLQKFALACKDPFDERCFGVAAPDDWKSVGCVQAHCRWRGTVFCDENGAIACLFMPSPCITMAFISTNATGVVPITPCSGPSSTSGFGYNTAASNYDNVYGITTDAMFGTGYTSWRPVAGGVRIRNNQSFQNVTGQCITAVVPGCGSDHLNQTTMNTYQNTLASQGGQFIKTCVLGEGTTTADLPSAQTIELRGAKNFAVDQIINKDYMLHLLPQGPTAYRWRAASTAKIASSSGAGVNMGLDILAGEQGAAVVGSNTNIVTGNSSISGAAIASSTVGTAITTVAVGGIQTGITYNTQGNNCHTGDMTDWGIGAFYADGWSAGATGVLSFDYILHYEGRPVLAASQISSFSVCAGGGGGDIIPSAVGARIVNSVPDQGMVSPEGSKDGKSKGTVVGSKASSYISSAAKHLYKHKSLYGKAALGAFLGHGIGYVAATVEDTYINAMAEAGIGYNGGEL